MTDIIITPPRPSPPIVVESDAPDEITVEIGKGPLGPAGPGVPAGGTTGQVLAKNSDTSFDTEWVDQSGGGGAWGDIIGTLSDQTDLQAALDGKAATVHTHTASQISDSTAAGRTLLTAADATAQRAALNVANGATANSPDATLLARANHTGTQAPSTISKTSGPSFVGTTAGGAGVMSQLTPANAWTALNTSAGLASTGIAADAVTYDKIQNVSAASKLLGRGDSGAGDVQEITLGSGLTMTGATLSASGGGGGGATSGSATIDFGAAPGSQETTLAVTGQAGILAGSPIRVWIQGEASADHNAYEHSRILAGHVGLAVESVSAGVGFTIVAASELQLTGQVSVRWQWG